MLLHRSKRNSQLSKRPQGELEKIRKSRVVKKEGERRRGRTSKSQNTSVMYVIRTSPPGIS